MRKSGTVPLQRRRCWFLRRRRRRRQQPAALPPVVPCYRIDRFAEVHGAGGRSVQALWLFRRRVFLCHCVFGMLRGENPVPGNGFPSTPGGGRSDREAPYHQHRPSRSVATRTTTTCTEQHSGTSVIVVVVVVPFGSHVGFRWDETAGV